MCPHKKHDLPPFRAFTSSANIGVEPQAHNTAMFTITIPLDSIKSLHASCNMK